MTTSTAANINPVTPQMVQSSAFQSIGRNSTSLEFGNSNVFQSTSAVAVSENLTLTTNNNSNRPQMNNSDLQEVQQDTTMTSKSPKMIRILRENEDDCQKIANLASSSETNFCQMTADVQQPLDCLARLETPDCLYFVCKKRLVIGRETAHSTADVSFKKTFVSRAHLELSFVVVAASEKTENFDEDNEDKDEGATSRDDGVWLLKCNGKNGILVNNVQFNRDEADRVLPTECILRFPSTDIQLHFSYSSSNARNFGQKQQQPNQRQPQISPVTPVNTPATEFEQQQQQQTNGVAAADCSSSSLQTCSVHPEDPACTSSKVQDEDSRYKNCDDLDSSIEKCNNRTPSLDYDFEQADADESSDCDGFSNGGDDKDGKPPYSYAQLIVQAIASTEDKQMTLAGIYAYITKHYAYYRTCDKGWQNSIRHNLSLCRHFVRVPRSQDEPGKGSFWRIDPSCESKQIQTAYKKRRQGKNSICLASTSATTSTSSVVVVSDVNGFAETFENSKLQDILSNSSIDTYARTFPQSIIDSTQSIVTCTTTTPSSVQRHSSSTDSFYSNQSSQFRLQEDDWKSNNQVGKNLNFTNNEKSTPVYCNGRDYSSSGESTRKNSTVIEFAGDNNVSKDDEIATKFSTPPSNNDQSSSSAIFPSNDESQRFSLPQSSTSFYESASTSKIDTIPTSSCNLFPNVIAGGVPSSRGDTICVVNNRTQSLKLPLAPKTDESPAVAIGVHFKDQHLTHEYEPAEYCGSKVNESIDEGSLTKLSNQNNVALSISPHLKNFMQENEGGGKFSRFLSKSAPSSPKSYSKKATSAAYSNQTTEKDSGRVHHHSTGGGTFSVRRNASDGRQRLQICHSPPFHVPVESTETSALRAMMMQDPARSRRNSGQVAAASSSSTIQKPTTGAAGVTPSMLSVAANRIGSKSLSTTPTRELLAGAASSRYEYQKVTPVNHYAAPQPSHNAAAAAVGAAKRSTLDQLSAKQKALRFAHHQRHSVDGGVASKAQPQPANSFYAAGDAYRQNAAMNNAFLHAGNAAGLQQAMQHRSAPASPLNLLNFLPTNHHHAAAAAVLAAGLTPPPAQQPQQQRSPTSMTAAATAAVAAAAAANLAAQNNTNPYANLLNNPSTAAAVLNNLVVAAAANQAALMLPALGYDVSNAPLLAAAGLLPTAASPATNNQSPLYAAALANNLLANLTAAAAVAADQAAPPSSPNNRESPSSQAAAATAMAAFLLTQRQRAAAAAATQQQAATLTLPTNLSPPDILVNGANLVLGGGGGAEQQSVVGGKRAATGSPMQDFAPKMSRH